MEETPDFIRDMNIERKLIEKGYNKFNSELINSPKDFMANNPSEICKAALTQDANYDYILDLRVRDFGNNSIEHRRKHIENLRKELAEYESYLTDEPFPCANLWIKEIDELKEVLEEISSTF
jgi:hypothetical protein